MKLGYATGIFVCVCESCVVYSRIKAYCCYKDLGEAQGSKYIVWIPLYTDFRSQVSYLWPSKHKWQSGFNTYTIAENTRKENNSYYLSQLKKRLRFYSWKFIFDSYWNSVLGLEQTICSLSIQRNHSNTASSWGMRKKKNPCCLFYVQRAPWLRGAVSLTHSGAHL